MRKTEILFLCTLAFPAHADSSVESPLNVEGAVTISVAEAYEFYLDGVVFIDTRSAADYEAGRIPDANRIHIHSESFTRASLIEFATTDQPLVFYCNGVLCPLSSTGARKAVAWGFGKVYYFREGYPGWEAAGLPIE